MAEYGCSHIVRNSTCEVKNSEEIQSINLKSSNEEADINIIKQLISCTRVRMKNRRILWENTSVFLILNACIETSY